MSNLNDLHSFAPFVSGKSAPFVGQRLVKVTYKTSRGGKPVDGVKPNVCMSVPILGSIGDAELQALVPHIQTLLENAQDGIVKAAYERGAVSVADAELSVACCIEYLDADASGDRLTKEIIAAWFNEAIADSLQVALADKWQITDTPTPEQQQRIDQTVNVYRDKFSSMAGGKTLFNVGNCESLKKALELASDDDLMAQKFGRKLDSMIKKQADMLDGL